MLEYKEEHMIGNWYDFKSVICVTGHKGAGKDEFCKQMMTKGYASMRFSDPIRAEAVKRYGVSYTVEQLIGIGDEGRRQNGTNYWAEQLIELAAKNKWKRFVLNGARNPEEITAVENAGTPFFTLIGITAPTVARYERIAKRGQTEDRAELESFLRMDDTDRGIGQPADGQQVDRCMARVPQNRLYNNAGTLVEYHAWIDAVHAEIELRYARAVH